jgi:hypothetical protein
MGVNSDVSNAFSLNFTASRCPTSKTCSLTDSLATYITTNKESVSHMIYIGGVRAGKTRSERWNSKSKKEGLKRRKTSDFNFKKTDEFGHQT